MSEERRKDIGSKVKDGIILSMLTSFIITAWCVATAGRDKALALEVRVAGIESCMTSIKEDLKEIKDLLKRSTPFERTK